MWAISSAISKFDAARDALLRKKPMEKADFEQLTARARHRAFTVANVSQMDMIAQVMESLADAINEGQPLSEWRAAIGEALARAWAGTVKNPPWRLETIYRTNLQNAFAAGRLEQQTQPEVIAARPFWLFDATIDGRQTQVCEFCDGTILPASDPWWRGHRPPLHFNCRSDVVSLDAGDVQELTASGKYKFSGTPIPAQPGFSQPPSLANYGFADAVAKYRGQSVADVGVDQLIAAAERKERASNR
jgi:SPP1 gp7 family putative phage head morphogenesis protein